MIAATFGSELDLDVVEKAAGIENGKIVTTLDLAVGASRVLARGACDVLFCSTSPGFNTDNLKQEYYQRYNASSVEASGCVAFMSFLSWCCAFLYGRSYHLCCCNVCVDRLLVEAADSGIRVETRSLTLAEVEILALILPSI